MLPENALDQRPEFGPDTLPDSPVNGDILPYRFHELTGDSSQSIIPQDLYGAVVCRYHHEEKADRKHSDKKA